jgi:seryl-tRNA synthetase
MNPNQTNINQTGNTSTDHDNLVTLINEVKTLGKGQEEIKDSQNLFHKEMRETLAKMQDGVGDRISKCEQRIATLEVTKADFREKLSSNKQYLVLLTAIGVVLVGLLIWHITGYHI